MKKLYQFIMRDADTGMYYKPDLFFETAEEASANCFGDVAVRRLINTLFIPQEADIIVGAVRYTFTGHESLKLPTKPSWALPKCDNCNDKGYIAGDGAEIQRCCRCNEWKKEPMKKTVWVALHKAGSVMSYYDDELGGKPLSRDGFLAIKRVEIVEGTFDE